MLEDGMSCGAQWVGRDSEKNADNTYLRMHDGKLLKQVIGIPMGDSLSPAIAVGTLAYMEMEWMSRLDPRSKKAFPSGTIYGRYTD